MRRDSLVWEGFFSTSKKIMEDKSWMFGCWLGFTQLTNALQNTWKLCLNIIQNRDEHICCF